MNRLKISVVALVSVLGMASLAHADVFEPRRIDPDVWKSPHFQRAHPDLKYRVEAINQLEDGHLRAAITAFENAAQWGDKLSQAMLGEIYWEGKGAKVDRARAYAWMDLAAERGFAAFVSKREKYWAQMSASERDQALVVGSELYASYGDDVALPKLDSRLFRERGSTGSRLGFAGNGAVVLPETGGTHITLSGLGPRASLFGGHQIPLYAFYSPQLWRFDKYLDWHADELELARRGVVRVGTVDESTAPVGPGGS